MPEPHQPLARGELALDPRVDIAARLGFIEHVEGRTRRAAVQRAGERAIGAERGRDQGRAARGETREGGPSCGAELGADAVTGETISCEPFPQHRHRPLVAMLGDEFRQCVPSNPEDPALAVAVASTVSAAITPSNPLSIGHIPRWPPRQSRRRLILFINTVGEKFLKIRVTAAHPRR